MTVIKSAVSVLVLVIWISGLAASCARATDHIDIRGKITQIQRESLDEDRRSLGMISVQSEEGNNATPDKANLIVTLATRILKEQDGERLPAAFEDLKAGEFVEARFAEGPTIMIYPLRVEADEIVILQVNRARR